MKFLVVGLGSMGKRRIRNLKEIGINDIIGYDTRDDRKKQASNLYSIKIASSFESALAEHPDAMIISTQPDTHKEYALLAAKNKIHFFTEVNTMEPKDMQIIIEHVKQSGVVGIPSSNLMFHPSISKIKSLIQNQKIGKILTFNFHSGNYLPGWHPWEKLEDYYVYDKDAGGGRDQIMWELSWIFWLLGEPKMVSSFARKLGPFTANIFDVYNLMIEFKNGIIGNVLVDVIQRPPSRFCEIIGEEGTIKWDYDQKSVKVFSTSENNWKVYPESDDYKGYTIENPKPGFALKHGSGIVESYVDEIKNFIDIIKRKKQPEFTFEDEKILLDLLYMAERSSKSATHLKF